MTKINEQKRYWVWLSSLEGIGPVSFYELIAKFEDAKSVWDAVKLNNKELDFLSQKRKSSLFKYHSEMYIDDLFGRCQKNEVRPITRLDNEYPTLLSEVAVPPPTLYIKGKIENLTKKSIAIVGTRKCNRKALDFTENLAEELALSGVAVISGMARGIDTASHKGALRGKGKTFAVLGCGADIIYPSENENLYYDIQKDGAVISEYTPGMQPIATNFPPRNRIISGLSKATLIVESLFKGGANITMKYATDQGRDIMAVPGAPYENKSELPNFIIKNGGIVVRDAKDILDEYGWGNVVKKQRNNKKINLQLDFFEQRLYNLLLQGDLSIEDLEIKAEIDTSALYSSLTMMEMKGIIKKLPGNIFGLK
jgi:DNA processing protein